MNFSPKLAFLSTSLVLKVFLRKQYLLHGSHVLYILKDYDDFLDNFFSVCLSHMTKSMLRWLVGAVFDLGASDHWKGFIPESLLYLSDQ